MNKRYIFLIIAIILFIISISFFFADNINLQSSDTTQTLEIAGKDFIFPDDFNGLEKITIKKDSGYALFQIVEKSGVKDPEKNDFVIIAEDGYQKTYKWEDLEKGIITEERKIVFPHLPKAFNIKNVIKIQVKE